MTPAAAVLVTTLALGWPPLLTQRPKVEPDVDPNLYAGALGTEVTYDDAVANGYDDGYGPRVSAPFEAALAPYGTWIDDERLGRVWVPSADIVGVAFAPYATNGRWVLTQYGWTWSSKWSWGWAPFHYGRWVMRDGRQWCWVPGTLWAPAWVSWRIGHSNIGWAPLPPRGMKVGRPIGTRSPWTFARATSLGGESLDLLPRRAVPGVFVHTIVVSRARAVTTGNLRVKIPAGPNPLLCCGTERRAVELSIGAPDARPRAVIEPCRGTPVETRPWIAAGLKEQTPIVPWPPAS
jgi:hypothetical protein